MSCYLLNLALLQELVMSVSLKKIEIRIISFKCDVSNIKLFWLKGSLIVISSWKSEQKGKRKEGNRRNVKGVNLGSISKDRHIAETWLM